MMAEMIHITMADIACYGMFEHAYRFSSPIKSNPLSSGGNKPFRFTGHKHIETNPSRSHDHNISIDSKAIFAHVLVFALCSGMGTMNFCLVDRLKKNPAYPWSFYY